jgi:prevent-host-death family protein
VTGKTTCTSGHSDHTGSAHPPAILKLSDVRSNIADLVNRVHYGGERVVIGRAGKALAALISMQDLGLLEHLIEEAEDRIDVAEADRIAADEPESLPWEEVRRGLEGASAVHDRDQAKRRAHAAPPARSRPREGMSRSLLNAGERRLG